MVVLVIVDVGLCFAVAQNRAQHAADVGVVPDDRRHSVDRAQSFRIRGRAASNHDYRGFPATRSPTYCLAVLSACGGGYGAGVHQGDVVVFIVPRGSESERLEDLAELLRLVLIDFTAQRGNPILSDHGVVTIPHRRNLGKRIRSGGRK